jgi:arabinofuranosyltransferase
LPLASLPVAWGVLGWRQRWIADDGDIVARTVREILAGNGPVFNPGERVESFTSVLWTWLALRPPTTRALRPRTPRFR